MENGSEGNQVGEIQDCAALDHYWSGERSRSSVRNGALQVVKIPPRNDPANYKPQCSNPGCKVVWSIEGIILGDNQTIGPHFPPELVCPNCHTRDFRIVFAPREPQ